MIPGKLVRFLEQYANVAFAGIRDRDLVPFAYRVSGWRVGADQRTMTILVPDEFCDRLVDLLQHNREVALTVEEFPSHETYQFKGLYRHHRPIEDDDVRSVDRVRSRFVKSLRPMYPDAPEHVLMAWVSPPSLAVEFEVLEIYLQTPGPGAGVRLVPPAEP